MTCNRILMIVLIAAAVCVVDAGMAASEPTEQWNTTFGGNGADMAYSVQQTSDGGYILAGKTYSYGSGYSDAWLIKTDANDNEQWNRTFGGVSSDWAHSVQQTSDGGYILAGSTGSYGADNDDFWIIKTDANGNEQWNRTFGGADIDWAHSVQQTSNGGYILAGRTYSYGSGYSDAWLIKTDANGDKQWDRTFGGADSDSAGSSAGSVQQTSDGGYILAGSTGSYGAGNDDAWLIKTDANGNEQWNRTFGGADEDWGRGLVQMTSEGGYILSGQTRSYGAGSVDAWIIKTDVNGNEQWNRTFGGADVDSAFSVQQTLDGGYILACWTLSYGAGNYDAWLIKTDANGNEQWNRTFGGSSSDRVLSVQQTSDGGYILAGYTWSYGVGSYDVWLIKVSGEAGTTGSVHNINKGINYTTIQAAIDDASPDDEIHVDSGTYYENVGMDKRITLIGEGADVVTVRAANSNDHVFNVTADRVNITGLKVIGATGDGKAGIYVGSSIAHSKISNCAASNNYYGIYLDRSSDNILTENTPSKNYMHGIRLAYSSSNILIDNIVSSDNGCAILLYASVDNRLINNDVSNSFQGIYMYTSSNDNWVSGNTASNNWQGGIYIEGNNNTITGNTVSNNDDFGIVLESSSNNTLYHNNLDGNTNNNAFDDSGTNQWDSGFEGNYYSDYTGTDSDDDGIGDTPYPIPGGSSEDRYPLMESYSPPTDPQDKSLVQVEGQPEVYWLQNNKLYWITDWDVINNMAGVPGWDSVNTLPSSEFDLSAYPQGPRFITTGIESDNLLIREQGDIKVYLILGGEKHHFTSPEALTWNRYGFDDVIEVSSSIIEMFPEGTPISIQDKQLLREPGGTDVFWSQNGKLYYVTADALNKMLDIYGWGWDEINEPEDFNPEDSSHYRTFITTGVESNGVLIRLWGDYKVYRIEDGFRRHVTYPNVMELEGYAMEDVIDVSQEIIDMFPIGDPIGIEVNLTFSKKTDSGEELYVTRFTTDETVKFYTEITVSESYTVDTYVKLIEPNGRTRYAYYTNPDFQPSDQLLFSDTEVPLYPGHWDAVSTNWNWNEYTFDDDEEGVYTWEFYYKDVISGKVLGWDKKSYVFTKKTDLGITLDISTNKKQPYDQYGVNENIIITANVYDVNGNVVIVGDFEVRVDNNPQSTEFNQIGLGIYEITGVKAPAFPGNHQIDVAVVTEAGNAFDTEIISVGGDYETYKVLMILASPYDIMDNSPSKDRPSIEWDGADWYETHGSPEWYQDVADEISDYYWRISYGKVNLKITTTDKWLRLPKSDSDYGSRINWIILSDYFKDAKEVATNYNQNYNENNYDLVIAIDPTSPGDDRYARGNVGGITIFSIVVVGTPYIVKSNSDLTMVRITAHEISHWIDKKNDEPLHFGKIIKWHGDCLNSYHSIMGPMSEWSYDIPGYLAPFDPPNAKKMDFSTYSEISIPSQQTLIPIESGKDHTIYFSEKVHNFNPLKGALQWHTIHYFLEFRDNSWPSQPQKPEFEKPAVILWKSDTKWRSDPREDPHRRDHPDVVGGKGMNYPALYTDNIGNKKLSIYLKEISNSKAVLDMRYSTDVFAIADRTSEREHNIKIYLIGNFFENIPYNFSVIDTLDQSEVFNSTLITNLEGFFDSPISFKATLIDDIEAHPYLIRVHTFNGWVPFLIATPSIIDGISNEIPFFVASDPTETNTAGDLTNLTTTIGSMKLSLKTAMPVDIDLYKYVIYLDSDNSTDTGSIVNSIGADYKIEYSNAGARLYKHNTSWTLVDTPYLNASHSQTNIEILTSIEIMNGTDTIKLVAQTFDSSDSLYDTLPDSTATQPYLHFFDVHSMDLRFAEYGYYSGDAITVNGYGFAQNQIIPISIKNQTGNILWNGSVQANLDGQVINVSTWTVPDDFYQTAYLYWAGAQMDSFSRLTPPLPVYNAKFELDAPKVVGIENQFNVTVSFENIGDDLTNLTLNLNTSEMTTEPETIRIDNLVSGQNYTYTWNLTPIHHGFALVKAEMCTDQTIFNTDQKGIYIANISVEIDAPDNISCNNILEFNVSVINNQENITYTDLKINTTINNIVTNFTQPVISLSPEQTVNQSYHWDTENVAPGIYQIIVRIISNGVVLSISDYNDGLVILHENGSYTGPVHNIDKGSNYSTIQAAIDDASPGDEIYVDAGTYAEKVVVDKMLTLVGKGADEVTVTAVSSYYHVFNITANDVNISGFTVTGAMSSRAGIYLNNADYCNISHNTASDNYDGILLDFSRNCTLTDNIIASNNNIGINIVSCNNHTIYHNNLINNINHNAYDSGINQWNSSTQGNYYSDYIGIDSDGDGIGDIPYLIPGGSNVDHFPLIVAWKNLSIITIGSVTVDVNDTIIMPIRFTDVTNIQRVVLDLIYNPDVVTILNMTPSDAIPSSTITYTLDTGKAAIELISHDNITVTDATALIDIRFKTGENTSSTALEMQNVELVDDTGSHAPDTIVNGSITVCIKGDFNYNDRVDIGDAAKVAFMVAGKVSEDLRADFNNNGRVDVGDAAKISFYLAQKVDEL